jgi:putative PIN family toxin of toxin-antitoxin system
MIRAVIDTNVVVSAALNDDSLPAAVLSLALDKNILMFVSAPVLAEYETVLSRPHLKLPL